MNINKKELDYWLSVDVDDIFEGCKHNRETRFLHYDNGSNILLVCHADTVTELSGIKSETKNRINANCLDDRLGVYTAMHHLPAMGYRFDVLITDNEEIGGTTGQFYNVGKYDLIIELDRGGEDVVDYGLADFQLQKDLVSSGFKMGYGSYSDICDLDTDVACFNLGLGYHNAHQITSYMMKGEFYRNIERLVLFLEEFGGTKYLQPQKRSYNCGNDESYEYINDRWEEEDRWENEVNNMDESLEPCIICGSPYDVVMFNGNPVCCDCLDFQQYN